VKNPIEPLADANFKLSDSEFNSIRELLHSGFGIALAEEKRSLVIGRLQKALRDRGGITFAEYYRRVVADSTGREMSELINRLSTNHTFFNREKDHFEHFRKTALPEAMRRGQAAGEKDMRVWCAASSTGEEPYMLAMCLREAFGAAQRDWEAALLATDISERALAVARTGIYPADRMQDLPAPLREKYFVPKGPDFEAAPELKALITFRRFNLINPEYPFKRAFDAIFCRNVLIYFDGPTKAEVVGKMAKFLRPGAYLYLGHSETLGRETEHYRYVQPAVYRRKEGP
jgi:chemotaxis protein methyltransferase CheR